MRPHAIPYHGCGPRPPVLEVGESQSVSSSASSPDQVPYDDTDFFHERNDSQSSIGALSLRDMTMSPDREREHRMTPISRLPPEMLMEVFKRLGSTTDLKNCMLVSRTWSKNSVDILWHRVSTFRALSVPLVLSFKPEQCLHADPVLTSTLARG